MVTMIPTTRIYEEILGDRIDEGFLKECEWLDSIFQEIDYRAYAGPV